ncbi:hypothetical protein [Kitasatospora sp. HPMI-4]|uniref:hypothetical protein n=1 Tax=Kitasatospora sp. HPMI-4 TaxID=3448443 RepID=UPI003F1A6F7A
MSIANLDDMTRTNRLMKASDPVESTTGHNGCVAMDTWGEGLADDRDGITHVGLWSVRPGAGWRKRASLEIYEADELLDVMVVSALGGHQLLRGARHRVGADGPTGFAWGRLPIDGSLPEVTFTSGGLRGRSSRPARVVPLSDTFWLAWVEGGPCTSVRVRVPHDDTLADSVRAGRAS